MVIGVGNPYRRDDGVGPAVVDRLRGAGLSGVTLAESDGEACALMLLWHGRRLAIVVDAVRAEPPCPGRVHRLVVPWPAPPGRSAGTHATGPADAVALARALARLPQRLVVYGVEAADTGFGPGLSPSVASAADRLAALIIGEARAAGRAGTRA